MGRPLAITISGILLALAAPPACVTSSALQQSETRVLRDVEQRASELNRKLDVLLRKGGDTSIDVDASIPLELEAELKAEIKALSLQLAGLSAQVETLTNRLEDRQRTAALWRDFVAVEDDLLDVAYASSRALIGCAAALEQAHTASLHDAASRRVKDIEVLSADLKSHYPTDYHSEIVDALDLPGMERHELALLLEEPLTWLNEVVSSAEATVEVIGSARSLLADATAAASGRDTCVYELRRTMRDGLTDIHAAAHGARAELHQATSGMLWGTDAGSPRISVTRTVPGALTAGAHHGSAILGAADAEVWRRARETIAGFVRDTSCPPAELPATCMLPGDGIPNTQSIEDPPQ